MAQNRIIPYGYKLENGKVAIDKEESEIVNIIFNLYTEGSSYLTIAKMLTSEKVQYMPNRSEWNKNIIARMLQSDRYVGDEKYPQIINEEIYNKVKNSMKPYTHTISPEMKILKSKLYCKHCKQQLKRRGEKNHKERWYCETDINHISMKLSDKDILDSLINWQESIVAECLNDLKTEKNNSISIEIIRLENEIDTLLAETELKTELIKEKILRLASERFSICNETKHIEYEKLKQIKENPKKLDSEIIDNIILNIKIADVEIVEIELNNGKILMKG